MATAAEKALEKRAAELMDQLTNADKRAAVRFFELGFDELDSIDSMVLLAYVADRSNSIEHYDSLPLAELHKVILGD